MDLRKFGGKTNGSENSWEFEDLNSSNSGSRLQTDKTYVRRNLHTDRPNKRLQYTPSDRSKQIPWENERRYLTPEGQLRTNKRQRDVEEPTGEFSQQRYEANQEVFKAFTPIPEIEDKLYEVPRKKTFIKKRPKKFCVDPKGKVITMDSPARSTENLESPVFVDQLDLIKNLKSNPKIGFYYMIYAVDRSSEFFNPYALKVVPYKQIDKIYMTFGANGITQYNPPEMNFTPIDLWEQEYKLYVILTKIKTFKIYRKWKTIYVWKKVIFYMKIKRAMNNIKRNLFFCDSKLYETILEIKKLSSIFLNLSFIDTKIKQQMKLFQFTEIQLARLELVFHKLLTFRHTSATILHNICLKSFLNAGFTPNDTNLRIEQTVYGNLSDKAQIPKNVELKMSYTEQARKKAQCYRFSSFIYLHDYYQLSMMQNLLRNTYNDFLEILEIHTESLPTEDDLKHLNADYSFTYRNPATDSIKSPYFRVDLLINSELGIVLDPMENIFGYVLSTMQSLWEEHLRAINPLYSDELFYAFTRPMINNKVEVPSYGISPNIQDIMKEDPILISLKNRFENIFEKNFYMIKKYCEHFKHIYDFYIEDMNFDEKLIYENKSTDVFRNLCERYRTEEREIKNIVDFQPFGIFYLEFQRFKSSALPAPNLKQDILINFLPDLGKEKVDSLMTEARESIDYLNIKPVTTEEYVEYIKFIDRSSQKVDKMESMLDYVKELYDIMEEYKIPIPPDDMKNYLEISVYFTSLRLSVDKCLEERDKLITSFNKQLQKDINILIDNIQVINDKVSKPWLLDSNSNVNDCLEVLKDLNNRMIHCSSLANIYNFHQKIFDLQLTRFEILEQVVNDVKLRMLMWDSLDKWDKAFTEWYAADFNTLSVEDINNFVMKNINNIIQIEKGLVSNNILLELKEKVEMMKDKMPIIASLRNPNLQSRHWLKIEKLLNYKFVPEEVMTLQSFQQLGAFGYTTELTEIANAASSEAGLEFLLNKIEAGWKTIDFIVLPHKDMKDVYVLGSLEEIQATLDDSNINIQTIASSRHVGFIQSKVDDWLRRLDLFAKTLEAWQYCQQQWVYLEAIFSAPDIQRQLPIESKLFNIVDKSWKDIMRKTEKMPLALENCTQPTLYEQLIFNNTNLDKILKCLEAYLEVKRIAFPRFFFLSNDELLEILAQTRNPHAVQRHLQKCFDAIFRLEFGSMNSNWQGDQQSETKLTNDIIAMISPEGERVKLSMGLKARGNVENWLGKVEASMFQSLKKKMMAALEEYRKNGREALIWGYPSQIVLTVSQIYWAQYVHECLHDKIKAIGKMKNFEQKCFEDLNKLAAMVRGELPKLVRDIIINLITVDVHARDIISILVQNQVTSSSSFDWTKTLRYYWDEEIDNCVARMSNTKYIYGYEYLGAQRRLVITPLTDKCYLCLMGALQLDLGGAPAGPAGTGKTETTKDLAKALAVQCVVFNCSEGLDYKMMGRFFSGLATSGAWCCFDEFNRIDIEVLSVIAQQLITIRNAKLAKSKEFMFEGRKIKLVRTCAAFITMNPGYAGRTELPDNLKSLFRPISMMVPDYKLIAEVTLYSEGFESSQSLSVKMTLMYTLCSEQLSQQDHYDFGMRAVKSVLVMAGSLKRDNPDKKEDVVLIKALRDSNLPKFLADDAELFQGILGDLFPGVIIPAEDYGILQKTAITIMQEASLQPEYCSLQKVIQLHETMRVRHGVMLVGPTGSGKSTVLHTLKNTYTRLHKLGVSNQYYQPVHMYILNPKAVTIGELYGEVLAISNEWHDGLLGVIIRHACAFTTEDHQWVVCDGPVDAVWIENMNTVLDDNKMLCLANSERIKFTPYVHMIFEVADLAQASPATVSRCGMVYLDPSELKWLPRVKSWLLMLAEKLKPAVQSVILNLFETYVEDGFKFIKKYCDSVIAQVEISKVDMLCALLQSIILEQEVLEKVKKDSTKMKTFITQSFIFSYLWSLGGNITKISQAAFEIFIKKQFLKNNDAHISASDELWNIYMNTHTQKLEPWTNLIAPFEYKPEQPFFDILVPTINTVCFGYIMQKLIEVNKPVLFTGDTGVGKSVVTKMVLSNLEKSGNWLSIVLNFSAQTSSGRTQEILELKLDKKKKTVLGAPIGKRFCIFVDDVNMPKLDTYGSQPPIELLRQILDSGGFYDKEKLFWKKIQDVVLISACAPPGGGRNPLTTRFVRHFGMLAIPQPTNDSLKSIFKSIMQGFLKEFNQPVKDMGTNIINAAVELYSRIAQDLLPTPEKSHYVFNLRDLSKCIQGVLQADSNVIVEVKQMLRLFYHECLRVFHDRLINMQDKSYFYHLLSTICVELFNDEVFPLVPEGEEMTETPLLMFGDFLVVEAERNDRVYEEIVDLNKAKNIFQQYLDDYNVTASKEMNLIFFIDAIEHLCRLARILRSERGNGLLVGVGGMGKQSLTRLASHMNNYRCHQIEVSRNYDKATWNEDLRKFYLYPGAYAEAATFLFTDTQIVLEEFLEDINNTLNSGEIPNLFEAEELEKAIILTRPAAKDAGIDEANRDGIYQFFIGRVKNHLHLMLCMSPVGDAFRRRCRMFPSLVNCCTIDWFSKWPKEALLSVAVRAIGSVIIKDDDKVNSLASICVLMHESVEEMTVRFYEEMRRRYYTTPSSYLDLLKLYLNTLAKKSEKIGNMRTRIANGLNKITETHEIVATMKVQIIALGPQLKISSEEVSKLMKIVAKEQIECDKVRTIVGADEANAKKKTNETAALEAEARKDLEAALPALREAQNALASLNKNDINEIKVFNKPPQLVRFVMEAVCLLLREKTNWQTAKLVLGDVHFLDRLISYPKEKITDKLLKKLQQYVKNRNFKPDKVAKQSKVCKSICIWVLAIDGYAKLYRIVQPKRKKLKEAQLELVAIEEILHKKQDELADVEKQIKRLENKYNAAVKHLGNLEYNILLCESRLGRSGRLTSALADEEIRWIKEIKEFDKQIENIAGDTLVAAGGLAYLGAFTSFYREKLLSKWLKRCQEQNISTTENFSLVSVLADPYEIRMWNTYGLPRDLVSTENAILVTQAERWPLMIDPQEQANRWIRNMEQDNQLKICKITDSNFMRLMEICIRTGAPILLQEIGETLDPSLEPILLKQLIIQDGRAIIRLGENDVEYDTNFRLYITTKMGNPHYLPEICIKVTIVNFTVTPSGLEDQLLADVIRLEKPELEQLRNELVAQINADKSLLRSIENKILSSLFSSEGNILDNEELIESLNESKETSSIIATRLEETETTEQEISEAREEYRSVANRGSVLYFVVSNLGIIDPMYQFSLKYLLQIINNVIETSEQSSDLQTRLRILYDEITLSIYTNVSRGLFEKHKIVFSFMTNIAILLNDNIISISQWNFLLRGPDQIKIEKKPDYSTLTDSMWNSANYLSHKFKNFEHLKKDMFKIITVTIEEYKEIINVLPDNKEKVQHNWDEILTDIEKLMLLKALKEEKLIFGITAYVKKNLGQKFVESPIISLQDLYTDTSKITPLVFVLSTGSDPFSGFLKFARDMEFTEKYQSISLGQGQGPIAEALIKRGCQLGEWIFLQNCHLATSWMLSLESLVIWIIENPDKVHDDFRLYLSSMPNPGFPVSVLQNSVKVTNEPPKGLKANVNRAFYELQDEFFEENELGNNWRRMIFGVCFFHAIIQERKKFGPLGWNIIYEFSDNDRECCLLNMKMFCLRDLIPWDALIYTTGEITYGGRITDNWDLRCLKTILDKFLSSKTLDKDYLYSPSGTYYAPSYATIEEYRTFISKFPLIEDPEIFGMHENANTAFQLKESKLIIEAITEVQPKIGMSKEGKSDSEIAYSLSESIIEKIALQIDIDTCHPDHLKKDKTGRLPSLTVVLIHEVERYNLLLKQIHISMENLQKAIKGFVVMSEELENVFRSLVTNQVPEIWHKVNVYPSLKTLESYIKDLELRIDFIKIWLTEKKPISFWISGLSFPQGFITGMLQTHARKYNIPIDHLKLDFKITNVFLNQEDIEIVHKTEKKDPAYVYQSLQAPEDGVLIHGLFIDAGKWDSKTQVLVDASKGEMNPPLPVVLIIPVLSLPANDTRYVSPLYKTSVRAGVLSTTGHSTNFVMSILLPASHPQPYWILKGTALLIQITN
ncbi:PREDICTED: dynein heavy chain 6, axonemal [Ceratosolen solmsi marchali]|uniref:Dynein heavy chain 6, axonemal n=1 Tax=Ceratosolen solmsi marchali TaxID=326594 RepID=A0AAJ6VMM0_9HYME|nr:PREDICTED: dynein heavy chain 6, axonemal [Ceratosolen solmsi marchali]